MSSFVPYESTRAPTQSIRVSDCNFVINVLDLTFALHL